MWLPFFGLSIGILLGFLTSFSIPENFSNYLAVAVLASFDTLLGGIYAYLNNTFENKIFVTGFFFNIILATSLTFLGVQLGVDLYLVAVFAFGVRLFNNIAKIRRILLDKWIPSRSKNQKREFEKPY